MNRKSNKKIEELYKATLSPVTSAGQLYNIAVLYNEVLGIVTIPMFIKRAAAGTSWEKIIRAPWKQVKSFDDVKQLYDEAYLTKQRQFNHADGYGLASIMGLSSYICIDVDNEELMQQRTPELAAILQSCRQQTMVVRSINGGLHYYFRKPDGVILKDKLFAGIYGFDIRAQGLIILPPSGTTQAWYTWENVAMPMELPKELLAIAQE